MAIAAILGQILGQEFGSDQESSSGVAGYTYSSASEVVKDPAGWLYNRWIDEQARQQEEKKWELTKKLGESSLETSKLEQTLLRQKVRSENSKMDWNKKFMSAGRRNYGIL